MINEKLYPVVYKTSLPAVSQLQIPVTDSDPGNPHREKKGRKIKDEDKDFHIHENIHGHEDSGLNEPEPKAKDANKGKERRKPFSSLTYSPSGKPEYMARNYKGLNLDEYS